MRMEYDTRCPITLFFCSLSFTFRNKHFYRPTIVPPSSHHRLTLSSESKWTTFHPKNSFLFFCIAFAIEFHAAHLLFKSFLTTMCFLQNGTPSHQWFLRFCLSEFVNKKMQRTFAANGAQIKKYQRSQKTCKLSWQKIAFIHFNMYAIWTYFNPLK